MTNDKAIDVDDNNFQAEVEESPEPVLVVVGAAWCPPCRALESTLEDMCITSVPRLKVCRMDIAFATEIGQRLDIRAVPACIVFEAGAPCGLMVGNQRREKIEELIALVIEGYGTDAYEEDEMAQERMLDEELRVRW